MEKLKNTLLHLNIHLTLEKWYEGIRKVQACRSEEIINAANRYKSGMPRHQDDNGKCMLSYLKDFKTLIKFKNTIYKYWKFD